MDLWKFAYVVLLPTSDCRCLFLCLLLVTANRLLIETSLIHHNNCDARNEVRVIQSELELIEKWSLSNAKVLLYGKKEAKKGQIGKRVS